jgi:hypothetical protein
VAKKAAAAGLPWRRKERLLIFIQGELTIIVTYDQGGNDRNLKEGELS